MKALPPARVAEYSEIFSKLRSTPASASLLTMRKSRKLVERHCKSRKTLQENVEMSEDLAR